jgi:hypothetical protein
MKMSDEMREQIEFFNKHLLDGMLSLGTYKLIVDNYDKLLQLKHEYKLVEREILEEMDRLSKK